MTLREAFDYVESRGFSVRLIPYEHEDGMAGTKAELDALGPGQDIAVFIGPEGGFDEREIESGPFKGCAAHQPGTQDTEDGDSGPGRAVGAYDAAGRGAVKEFV